MSSTRSAPWTIGTPVISTRTRRPVAARRAGLGLGGRAKRSFSYCCSAAGMPQMLLLQSSSCRPVNGGRSDCISAANCRRSARSRFNWPIAARRTCRR